MQKLTLQLRNLQLQQFGRDNEYSIYRWLFYKERQLYGLY